MIKTTKVGLKFCGGCNARYDRTKMVRLIRDELDGIIEFVPPDDKNAEFILAVEGCKTACADLKPYSGKPIRIITSEEQGEELIRELKEDG